MDQGNLTYLLDECEYVLHRALERVLVHSVFTAGQMADDWGVVRARVAPFN